MGHGMGMRITLDVRVIYLATLILFVASMAIVLYPSSNTILKIAVDNHLVVTGKVSRHATPINTPFYFANKGMMIYSVPTDKGVLYYRSGWPSKAILNTPDGEVAIN